MAWSALAAVESTSLLRLPILTSAPCVSRLGISQSVTSLGDFPSANTAEALSKGEEAIPNIAVIPTRRLHLENARVGTQKLCRKASTPLKRGNISRYVLSVNKRA